jgi:hypothetical protein
MLSGRQGNYDGTGAFIISTRRTPVMLSGSEAFVAMLLQMARSDASLPLSMTQTSVLSMANWQ